MMKNKAVFYLLSAATFASVFSVTSTPVATSKAYASESVTNEQIPSAEVSVDGALRPIVFVPGTGGVQFNGSSNSYNYDETQVWVDRWYGTYIDDDELLYHLQLQPDGRTLLNSAAGTYVHRGNISAYQDHLQGIREVGDQPIYEKFITDLQAKGYVAGRTLFGVAYDWRLRYSDHFAMMKSRIDYALSQSGSDKVYLIGHSQGTQIIKHFLEMNPTYQGKVAGAVFVGAPNLGAAKAVRASSSTLGGYDMDAYYFGLGISPMTGYEISKNSPSLYMMSPPLKGESELQRTTAYAGTVIEKEVWIDGWGSVTKETYLAPSRTPEAAHTLAKTYQYNNALESEADSAYVTWDSQAAVPVPFHSIIGTGASTEVSYAVVKTHSFWNGDYTDIEYRYADGDGTVPAYSSNPSFTHSTNITATYITDTSGDGIHVDMLDPGSNTAIYALPHIMNFINGKGAYAPTASSLVSDEQKADAQAPQAMDERGVSKDSKAALKNMTRDALSFVTQQLDGEYVISVTDKKTGNQDKFTITVTEKGGAVIQREGDATDALGYANLLNSDKGEASLLGIQIVVDSAKDYDIELISGKADAEFSRKLYQTSTNEGEKTKRKFLEPLKVKKGEKLKVNVNKGESTFELEGKKVNERVKPE
ncbi:alpha/beta fold hydrolase [Brevibacillus dissolubilis]|uniref:alpha/beta fold hydrolase n=1 Tax=Brevibacillus dissolubilis TaxID=1844116 RepID=UPI00159BC675|nr:alpha/beta fold hydrolase [Brevibacillus dissolubilis]